MADSTPQEVEVSADTTSAEAAFDAIKSLEGTWEGTLVLSDGREMPTSNEFKVVSGGNTVVETLIEGDVEMATTYTMEGGSMLTKHYCVLGTEPTFVGTLIDGVAIEFTPTAGTPYTVGEDDFVTGMTFGRLQSGIPDPSQNWNNLNGWPGRNQRGNSYESDTVGDLPMHDGAGSA